MRDKLIQLLDQDCGYVEKQKVEKLADYLIANGVIVLPCKIGTRIYRIVPNFSVSYPDPTEYKVIWDTFKLIDKYAFGKTVFLTREEAERSLLDDSPNL